MGTKENRGRFDCYGKAEPDEPMFILLARDPQAPQLIREWAVRRQRAGEVGDKIMEALSCASDMEEWHRQYENRPRPPIIEAND